MAEATYVNDGSVIDYTPSGAVSLGEVVVLGNLVGVAPKAIAASTLGSVAIHGAFDVAKNTGSGTDIAVGAILYWDATNNYVAKTDGSGTHKQIGKCIKAAAIGDTTVRLVLTP